MNCQGYVRLIAQGRLEEAARELVSYTPFGAILGRLCHHPCEEVCERSKLDGAIHIRALKRYLADTIGDKITAPNEVSNPTGKRTAVVGSGPAGLSAAYDLRRLGHEVTVFEASGEAGGLLRYGIPAFRLPPAIVDRAVRLLETMGIVFRSGLALGRDFELDRLELDFDAIALAIGASAPLSLEIPGAQIEGVMQALDLLRLARNGERQDLGGSVVVIGGGNTAVDAALSCRRLGLREVTLVCLEQRHAMPAFSEAVREAIEEGISIRNGLGPVEFRKDPAGGIEVNFSPCVSLYDEQGLFNPVLDSERRMTIQADRVVLAIGQTLKTHGLPGELVDAGTKRMSVDPETLESGQRQKIFACGDCVSGPSSVVEAMASGREAAISVDRYLRGEGLGWGRGFWKGPFVPAPEPDLNHARSRSRGSLTRLAPSTRSLNEEVEQILSSEQARKEAERCLSCGQAAEINQTCWYCLPCEIECPVKALEVRMPYLVR
jgi:NADPH-dependent glutamate synthase beta subunit-like oxidoreductase